MSFRRKKKHSFKVQDVEAYLKDHQSIEFAGSGDPHEEKGKIRLLLENLKAITPDILLFDGDYLAEPAYLKAGKDQAEIAKASENLSINREIFLQVEGTDWDIRQIVALPSVQLCRQTIKQEIQGGANSVLLKIASPYGSGVPIRAARDLETILEVIEIDKQHREF